MSKLELNLKRIAILAFFPVLIAIGALKLETFLLFAGMFLLILALVSHEKLLSFIPTKVKQVIEVVWNLFLIVLLLKFVFWIF
jgi:hypothetical protein